MNITKRCIPKSPAKVIDVSEFQSSVDWEKVKSDDIKGVIIRCGYRGAEKGTLQQDSMFFDHIYGAYKAGLKIGVYMFTQAVDVKEAKEEAAYALNMVKRASVLIGFPIAIDTENVFYYKGGKKCAGRANNLSKTKRTEVIKAFCEEIEKQGYDSMVYGSTSWLDNKLNMKELPYDVWVAQYGSECEYKGKYLLWQYTSNGSVDGVKGKVDMNYYYK